MLFDLFRDMHATRGFQLVLCADVWEPVGEYAKQVLKQAIMVENAAKRLGHLCSEPPVILNPQASLASRMFADKVTSK